MRPQSGRRLPRAEFKRSARTVAAQKERGAKNTPVTASLFAFVQRKSDNREVKLMRTARLLQRAPATFYNWRSARLSAQNTHTRHLHTRIESLPLSRIIILRAPLSFPARTPVFTQCLLLIDFQKIK
jgi:hypothetical protein